MVSGFLLGLATGFTQTLLTSGYTRLRDRVQGDAQERALKRVYEAAFTALLAEVGDGLSEAEIDTLANRAFLPFLRTPTVAAALLDVALIQRELDPAWLHAQFEATREADALHNIRFDRRTFERGLLEFQRVLTQEVLWDAAKPESNLFNLEAVAALQELLRRTEELLSLASASSPPASPFPLHLNLPSKRPHFVGRDELLSDITARLIDGQATALSAEGLPGVGKTTLAVHLAHDARIREHFVDGVLWAALGPEGDPLRAMGPWLEALDLDPRALPDLRSRAQAVRNKLAGRKVLIVWDDAWDPDDSLDVAALRCGDDAGCAYLLTTRNRKLAGRFANAGGDVSVAVLSDDEAYQLLHDLAPAACDADPDGARALATQAGGLPLTVELLGGYLADAGDDAVFADLSQEAMAELRDPRRRLDLARRRLEGVDGREETLRETIHFSLDALRRAGRDEAVNAFHALSAFAPKPATFTRDAAEQVAACDGRALQTLVQRNLLETEAGELTLHQTLHDVAEESLPVEVRVRHCDYYLGLVNHDRDDFEAIGEIYPQIEWAWQHIQDKDVGRFLSALGTYQDRRGLWQEEIGWIERGLEIAQEENNKSATGTHLNNLGWLHSSRGDYTTALDYLEQSLAIQREIGDKSGEGTTLNNISQIYDARGDYTTALDYLEQSLAIQREIGDKSGEGTTLNNISQIYDARGDYTTALDYLEQSLAIQREIGDKSGEGTTLNNISQIYKARGDYTTALDYLEQSLAIQREIGDKLGEGTTLNNMAATAHARGDYTTALDYLEQSLAIQREIGDKSGEGTTLNNISGIYKARGDYTTALDYLEQSLAIQREIGDVAGMCVAMFNMAFIQRQNGEENQALATWVNVYRMAKPMGLAQVLQALENLADQLGLPGGLDGWQALAEQMEDN